MPRQLATILLLLTLFVLSSSSAFATSITSLPVDFSALQKTCAVVHVQLNGLQHTITCSKMRSSNSKLGYSPDLSRVDCGFADVLDVHNYNYSAELCFGGAGYLGVQIYQVDEVDNLGDPAFDSAWLRYYNTSGHFCTIGWRGYALFSTNSPVYVTQLDLGSTNGSNCPHV